MTPPLLQQTPSQYFGQFGNEGLPPWATVLIIVVLVGLVVAAVVFNRRTRGAGTPEQQKRYTRRTFARTARAAGLDKQQTAMLERLVAACKVRQPLLVFSSSSVLDDVLKRGVYALESAGGTEARKQEQLRIVYRTKEIIENSLRRGGVQSTLALKSGLVMGIQRDGSPERYRSRLVANTREMLAAATVRDKAGAEQRWAKGTRCVVAFTREADAGYSFPTKILGYSTLKGETCMLLQHAKALNQTQQRRARRKELSRPCFVYPVKIVDSGSGRKTQRRAVVQQHQKTIGTVSDISAGGCAIRSREPLPKGTLVKVEMSLSRRDSVAAFGKVQRVRAERLGGVMHVMFTKVSGNALNRIYSYVYDYTAIG